MRKRLFLAMSAVVLLAGCSKDGEGFTNQGDDNESNNVNPDAVKIEMGTKGMSADVTPNTRGTLDKFNNTTVGIFALAKGIADPWALTDNKTCIMNNVEGSIADTPNDTKTGITFGNQTFYYPMSNTLNYSFFGYYPHHSKVTGSTVELDGPGTEVKVVYAFNGTQDIIYGSAVAPKIDTFDGYNARYFRKATGAVKPEITFHHKLTRLQFNIKAAGTPTEIAQAGNITVTAIEIVKVPTTVSLIVANRTDDTRNGTLEFAPLQGNESYILCDAADGPAAGVKPIEAGAPMGDFMMLPATAVLADGTYEAVISMTLSDNGVTKPLPKSTVPIKLNNNGKFEAGKSYKVNFSVYGPSQISMDAKLVGWIAGDQDADIEIN